MVPLHPMEILLQITALSPPIVPGLITLIRRISQTELLFRAMMLGTVLKVRVKVEVCSVLGIIRIISQSEVLFRALMLGTVLKVEVEVRSVLGIIQTFKFLRIVADLILCKAV